MKAGVVNPSAHLQVADFFTYRGEYPDKKEDDHKAHRVNGKKHRRNGYKKNNVAHIVTHKAQKILYVIRRGLNCENEVVVEIGIVVAFLIKLTCLCIKLFVKSVVNPFSFHVPEKLSENPGENIAQYNNQRNYTHRNKNAFKILSAFYGINDIFYTYYAYKP